MTFVFCITSFHQKKVVILVDVTTGRIFVFTTAPKQGPEANEANPANDGMSFRPACIFTWISVEHVAMRHGFCRISHLCVFLPLFLALMRRRGRGNIA